ncbi:MAG TPA: MFS transporter [Steroidobacteraceae bacterium]|nr:MFS transporter [Steroidobacteraceae bacterium]
MQQRSADRSVALQLTALFFVAFNLRVAMSCISPVVDHLRNDLQMNRAELGLLSTLPVLCMSLLAPFAQRLSAARGHETAILFATLLIALSALVRSVAGTALMLASAFTAGVGIAIAGTLLNTFVKEHFADRAVTVSGLYSAALCLGAALAAGLTAPIAEWSDSWRTALALWGIPGIFGAFLWWIMLKQSTSPTSDTRTTRAALPWRNRAAWLVTIFFGMQSVTFFVVLAWLAPMYVELGWSKSKAGTLLGIWVALQVPVILTVSRLASRSHDRRPWLIACSVAAAISFFGLATAPLTAPWLWILLFAFGSGGWFTLCMNLPLDYSRSPGEAGSWTAMMLCGGYMISASSPFIAGAVRDADASYSAIFTSMALLSLILLTLASFLRPRSFEKKA